MSQSVSECLSLLGLAVRGCCHMSRCLCYDYFFVATVSLKYNKVPQPYLKRAVSMTKTNLDRQLRILKNSVTRKLTEQF
jgi:hypothetical protein